ncbi:MAG: polymer-forming cytoskeletal protein [Salinibacter sp.]
MLGFFWHSSNDAPSPNSSSALSMIGEGSTVKGSFDLKEDDLCVNGVLEGDVQTEGHVHVARGGAIRGEIKAGSIRLAGSAEGVLSAQQDLVLLESSAVHGILCAEALTIEDGADFEGGICDTAERISVLETIFASTEEYTLPGLSSSRSETAGALSSLPSETTDRSVDLNIEQSSPPTNGDFPRPAQEGDGISAARSSSVAPNTKKEIIEEDERDAEASGDTETLSELEW